MKKKGISENTIAYYLISSALILFYFSDAINKYLQVGKALNDDSIENAFSLSLYVRLIYEILFASIILINFDLVRKKIILMLILILVCFGIGQAVFFFNYTDPNYNVGFHFTSLNKYLYVFIIYGSIYKFIEDGRINTVFKLYESIVLINSVLILTGLFLNIDLLKSYYSQDYRYGYDGLIPAINEATLFYFIAISYFYYRHFIVNDKNWKIYLVIFSSLFLGTKTIYLFLLMLFIYHLSVKLSLAKKILYLTGFSIVIGFIIANLVLNPAYSFLYDGFAYVYERDGFLSMITSGRINGIESKITENISYWNPVNYLFGGADQLKYYIEMDFFDLFLFLGIIGSFLLICFYYKSIFRNDRKIMFLTFFTFCYFLFAFLSGHILASAANALNLVLVSMYIKNGGLLQRFSITA